MAGSKKEDNIVKLRTRRVIARRSWMALRIFLILAVFAAALWGLNYFYNSSYFRVKEINIEGNHHYEDDDLNDLLDGIIGMNIFEVDKKSIEDSLDENMVWIKTSELKKIFPDRINLFIEERKPYLILDNGKDCYLVDYGGVVLGKINNNLPCEYDDLVKVRGAIEYDPEEGEVIARKNILSCADIYRGLDPGIKSLIKEAGIEDNIYGDIFFITFSGLKIIFGNSEQTVKKVEVLKLLLKEDANYIIIDLRNPDNPVLKY